MKSSFQKLTLQELKPIEIKLIGGNFEIITQRDLSIIVDASGITNYGLVPVIKDLPDKTVVSNQSIGSFFPGKEKIIIKIYIPENSQLTFRQTSCNVMIHGHYEKLKVKASFGNIKVDLKDFIVDNNADFNLFAGEVKFRKPLEMNVDILEEKHHKLVMQMGNKGKISAHVSVGDVMMKENFKRF